MRRWIIGTLATLALCVDGWGCGGATQQDFGWCCGEECGFSGSDADVFAGTVPPSIGRIVSLHD